MLEARDDLNDRQAGLDGTCATARAMQGAPADPVMVDGPYGPISRETLPPPGTLRWVVRRKAEVLAAIDGGLMTAEEACRTYRLSTEELDLWREAIGRAGVPGLRVTRIQLYRDIDIRRRPRSSAAVARADRPGMARPA